MKEENLKKIISTLCRVEYLPITPKKIFKKHKLNKFMSYKTFFRGVLFFTKERLLNGWRVGLGRGKGIKWIITSIDVEGLKQWNQKKI